MEKGRAPLRSYGKAIKEEIREMLAKVGHKINGLGKKASKRTRRFTNSLSIRAEITDKEKSAREYYEELGRKFYQNHKDNPQEEYQELFAAIGELEADIYKAEEERLLLKGIRRCPDCGSENPSAACYCAYCGCSLPVVEAEEGAERKRVCPKCGEELEPEAVFCTKCGYKAGEFPREVEAEGKIVSEEEAGQAGEEEATPCPKGAEQSVQREQPEPGTKENGTGDITK